MKLLSQALILAVLSVGFVSSPSTATTGGMLTSDTTLTKSNSPYRISKPIEIPEGVTLTIEEGVEIYSVSSNTLFFVHGTVRILGSADSPVRIASKGQVFYLKDAKSARIEIRFASIDGQNTGTFIGQSGYYQSAHYLITDSDFTNFGWFSYIWYPLSFVAERNVFTNSPGFSIGFSAGDRPAPVFRNNLFLGKPKPTFGKEYWIEAWASYDSTLDVNGNTFIGGPYTAITTGLDYDKTPLNARGNYWGTVDPLVINRMAMDRADALGLGTEIDTSGFLSAPDPLTPSGTRFVPLGPKPVKYRNCASLNRVYQGGVARDFAATNKGKKTRLTPTVNPRVFSLNRALDRDRDGIACER